MAEVVQVDLDLPQPAVIGRAAALIRSGEIVGIPTDTIYGVATDAMNGAAAEKVFALKQRAATAPLLILVNSLKMAAACAKLPSPLFMRLAQRFWPGPLTIVVPAADNIPPQVTAATGTVGIRYPDAPIALALIAAVGGPITATSANRSGEPECINAEQVQVAIGAGLRLILDGGPSPLGCPSTVISIVDGTLKVLREGTITGNAISAFLHS